MQQIQAEGIVVEGKARFNLEADTLEGQVRQKMKDMGNVMVEELAYGWELRKMSEEEFQIASLDTELALLQDSKQYKELNEKEKTRIQAHYSNQRK